MSTQNRVFAKLAENQKAPKSKAGVRKAHLKSIMDELASVDGLDFLVPFSKFLKDNLPAFKKQNEEFEKLIEKHKNLAEQLGMDWEKDIWEAHGYFSPEKMLSDNKKLYDILKNGDVSKLILV